MSDSLPRRHRLEGMVAAMAWVKSSLEESRLSGRNHIGFAFLGEIDDVTCKPCKPEAWIGMNFSVWHLFQLRVWFLCRIWEGAKKNCSAGNCGLTAAIPVEIGRMRSFSFDSSLFAIYKWDSLTI